MGGGKALRRRLDRIGGTLPAPAPPAAPIDRTRLTDNEWSEMETIAARCRPGDGPYPSADRWGLWALSDTDLERLEVLTTKLHAPEDS